MGWKTITDFLVYRTWWAYGPDPSWVEVALHAFNLLEGSVWLVLSGLVLRRFFRHRHSPIEVMYALAFFTFGLTDFREAYGLPSWLIQLKAANLVVLLWLRAIVIKRFYSGSKLF